MNKNDLITLKIEGYSSAGEGVSRRGGRVVFTRQALLGETVEARVLKVSGRVCWAGVERVLEASGERVRPACPNFGRCGGCDFLHMTYAEELRQKKQRVVDAFSRIGGLEAPSPADPVPSPLIEGYRNKTIFRVGRTPLGKTVTGFYRERSRDVVPCPDCLVQGKSSLKAAEAFREWADREKLDGGAARHLFVREGDGVQVALVTPGPGLAKADGLVSFLLGRLPEIASILLIADNKIKGPALAGNLKVLHGADYLEDSVAGLRYRLDPRAFYQINRPQAENLYAEVKRLAGLQAGDSLLDLYCGAGAVALTLAGAGVDVRGADNVPESIENATANAFINNIPQAKFMLADAAEAAARLQKMRVAPGVVTVDPPRKGLAPEVIDAVALLRPEKIIYASCDPATLARDVRLFAGRRYDLAETKIIDMFPRCAHVETIVKLVRNS
ncbi:MAG: 23S rRNA (uracil(1939)-C(5))-methyltransferase RlmD [Deltaproteobacteria bacterium]|jgi:23S rRNA (uracil1939-C5)-methyltransferase|nr:23S rRNA (uracil(1939)-C(5))-methyltransferase RlmD [Deltaproteobacteria bacterium]